MTFLARVASVLAQFLVFGALGTRFGPEETGLYWLCFAIVSVVSVLTRFGFDTGSMRMVPALRESGRGSEVPALARTVCGGALLLGGAAAALLYFGADLVAAAFREPMLGLSLRVASLALPAVTLSWVAGGLLSGAHRIEIAVWIRDVGQNVIAAGVIAALALARPALAVPLAAAIVVSFWISALLLLLMVRKEFGASLNAPLSWRAPAYREAWRYSAPLVIVTLFAAGSNYLDALLIGFFLNATDVGVYAVASRAVRLMQLGLIAAAAVHGPLVAGLYTAGNRDQLRRVYQGAARWAWLLGLVPAVVFLVDPSRVLALFGAGFAEGDAVLRILTIGQLVNIATGNCAGLLTMTGHQGVEARNAIAALALSIATGVALTPLLGAAGAALSQSLSLAVINLARVYQGHRFVGVLPFSAGMLRSGLAALVAAAAVAGASALPMGRLAVLVVETALAVAILAGGIVLLGLDPDDRRALQSLRRPA